MWTSDSSRYQHTIRFSQRNSDGGRKPAGLSPYGLANTRICPPAARRPLSRAGNCRSTIRQSFDPFVGLTAAAAVTQKLKLGTSVCLIPEHHPITLAKTIACLDRISSGRFLFGIGAGFNAEELADYGVAFQDRWKVTREQVLAMKQIWTKDVA